MAPPINPKVSKAVDAMCRDVGIEQAILRYGLKECNNLRHNLRKHMRNRQAPVARSTVRAVVAAGIVHQAELIGCILAGLWVGQLCGA